MTSLTTVAKQAIGAAAEDAVIVEHVLRSRLKCTMHWAKQKITAFGPNCQTLKIILITFPSKPQIKVLDKWCLMNNEPIFTM